MSDSTVLSGCRHFEARLEDASGGHLDAEVRDHLRDCEPCRNALADSEVGRKLLRDAWEPMPAPGSRFLFGVMQKIRSEQLRLEARAAFWNPLEFLASRFSLTAAMLLLALSAYLAGFGPRRIAVPTPRTEINAADFPQPPGDPVSNEEVLQSLAETNYER